MSAALADLFSETSPPPASPPRRSPSPATPPRHRSSSNPLFLSPGDTPHRQHAPPRSAQSPSFSPPPVRPDEIRTDGRGEMALGVGYDPLDLSGMFAAEAGESNALDEVGEGGGRKKRVMAKVDPERLTGEKGIPALMRAAKRFKPRGKGHEERDLRDMLTLYQIWAHGMFPKGDFEGTIRRVETVCRTRRMEVAMKGYHEAFHPPPPRSPSPPALSPFHTSPPAPPTQNLPDPEEADDRHDNDSLGERRTSEPLFDTGEMDDGPDFDELVAMEEMEREQEQAQARAPGRAEEHAGGRAARGLDDGEGGANAAHDPPVAPEEDEWEGLYD